MHQQEKLSGARTRSRIKAVVVGPPKGKRLDYVNENYNRGKRGPSPSVVDPYTCEWCSNIGKRFQ